MPKFIDRTGMIYGRLTVLRKGDYRKSCHCYAWWCRCECGTVKQVLGTALVLGNSTSCGCYRKEFTSISKWKHGHCINRQPSKEWNAWNNMKTRCYYTGFIEYHRYGGRGIRVCDRWLNSFANFFEDMGNSPSRAHSVERLNNDKNYSKSNCIWGTREIQMNNMSTNRVLEHKGRKQTMTQWAREVGMEPGTLWARLNSGWSTQKAITQPLRNIAA